MVRNLTRRDVLKAAAVVGAGGLQEGALEGGFGVRLQKDHPHLRRRNTTMSPWNSGSPRILLCLATSGLLMCSCIQVQQQPPERVVMDVRSAATGEPLSEWVVESLLWSEEGWSTRIYADWGPERMTKTTVLAVHSLSPAQNSYDVKPFSSGGVLFLPLLGYGEVKSERRLVYAEGHEIAREPTAFEIVCGGSAKGEMAVIKFTYCLKPWDNRLGSQTADEFLEQLKDRAGFDRYEAIRKTPQGIGVSALYRYYIQRFKALVEANRGLPAESSVSETVAWLEQVVAGNVPPKRGASPTTVRIQPSGVTREEVFRVVAMDAETGQLLDAWVTEVYLAALSLRAPLPARQTVIAVDSGTTARPDARVPPYTHTQRRDGQDVHLLPCPVVYVTGYDPSRWPIEDTPYLSQGMVLECRLRKWDNRDAQAIRDFVSLLEDEERFAQYNRLHRQALGVLDLYWYFQSRYDALDDAQRLALSEKAKQRVAWIREQVAAKPSGQ